LGSRNKLLSVVLKTSIGDSGVTLLTKLSAVLDVDDNHVTVIRLELYPFICVTTKKVGCVGALLSYLSKVSSSSVSSFRNIGSDVETLKFEQFRLCVLCIFKNARLIV
jgi:hypothetical protein